MGRSFLIVTSSTPAPSPVAIDDAASCRSSRRPLVTSLASRCSMTTHQPEFVRALAGGGARPAQIVQVKQGIRLAPLLEQVGDLRGDRALARPVDPGEQDAFSVALVHQPRLGPRRGISALVRTIAVAAETVARPPPGVPRTAQRCESRWAFCGAFTGKRIDGR
jgi:hypothetical protein